MSKASDMKAMRDTLTMYPLMTAHHFAQFLGCSDDHARELLKSGKVPFNNIGLGSKPEYRIDPMDAAVFHLSQREGITSEEFWTKHGPEGTPELCRRFVTRIRRVQAE